jgi:hypothetical protein
MHYHRPTIAHVSGKPKGGRFDNDVLKAWQQAMATRSQDLASLGRTISAQADIH